nr:hypothetical protein [uncultured bacterium]ALG87451.1 hypothetical protein [uncultured bacterium]
MGSGGLREPFLSNRENARAGYRLCKLHFNPPLPMSQC